MTTKLVETWHLEFCLDGEPDLTLWHGPDAKRRAEEHAEMCRRGDLVNGINHIDGYTLTHIRVTGPHMREVDAEDYARFEDEPDPPLIRD